MGMKNKQRNTRAITNFSKVFFCLLLKATGHLKTRMVLYLKTSWNKPESSSEPVTALLNMLDSETGDTKHGYKTEIQQFFGVWSLQTRLKAVKTGQNSQSVTMIYC